MATQTEALKSAIEFAEFCLEELDLSYMASNQAKRLVEKAKEALAHPEQEPVAIELALAGLVDKITGGLDSGDLLADAVAASKAISIWKTPLKDSELLDAFCNTPHGDVHQFISAFISGARFAEWHHSGIKCGKE